MNSLFAQEALDDIERAATYYLESASKAVASAFFRGLTEARSFVEDHPLGAPLLFLQVRRKRLTKFPFLLFYVAEPDRVVILRVLHSAQDPARWPITDRK